MEKAQEKLEKNPHSSKNSKEYEDVLLGEIEDIRKRLNEFLEKSREEHDIMIRFNLEKLKMIEKLRKEKQVVPA